MKLFKVFGLSLYNENVSSLGFFENVTIKKIFLYHRQQAEGKRRKCNSEELRNFHSSENIIRFFSCRKMDSAGHVTQYGTREIYKEIVMWERKTFLGKKRSGR